MTETKRASGGAGRLKRADPLPEKPKNRQAHWRMKKGDARPIGSRGDRKHETPACDARTDACNGIAPRELVSVGWCCLKCEARLRVEGVYTRGTT